MTRFSFFVCVAVSLCIIGLVFADEQEQMERRAQQVFVPQGRTVLKAINAGGDDYKSADGTLYEADTDYSTAYPSEARENEGSLTDGFDNELYVTERVGPQLSYMFDLPKRGTYYTLVLKFAETSPDAATGANVFDVALNGRALYQSIDIFSVIGAGIPMDLPMQFFYTATGKLRFSDKLIIPVTDDQLVLELVAREGNAKVSAVTLFRGLLQTNEGNEQPAEKTDKKVKDQSLLRDNGPLIVVIAVAGVLGLVVVYYARSAPKKLSKSDKKRKIGQSIKKQTSPRKE